MGFDISPILKSLGEQIIGPILVGAIIYAIMLLQDKIQKTRIKFSVRMTAEKSDKIQTILLEIRIRLNADRAYLAMYHNGNKYIEGSELIKKSRTNEVAAPGVSLEAHQYQNILISLLPEENKLVVDEGASFTKVDSLPDGKFRRMCESRGIKCVARCAIRHNDDIIGFVGVDYNDDIEQPENISDLCRYAGILEQILTDYRGR